MSQNEIDMIKMLLDLYNKGIDVVYGANLGKIEDYFGESLFYYAEKLQMKQIVKVTTPANRNMVIKMKIMPIISFYKNII